MRPEYPRKAGVINNVCGNRDFLPTKVSDTCGWFKEIDAEFYVSFILI